MALDRLEPTEIAELVRRAAAGEQTAWETIVARLGGVVWAVVRAHRLDASDAEDAVQGVWLRLAQHLGRLQQPERLPGWLATTTRNECLLVLRRSARAAARNDAIASSTARLDPGVDPTASIELAERREAVGRALDAVEARCRELLLLVAQVPPLSYADVSESLGIAVSAIGPTRSRCLEKVRRHRDVRRLLEAEGQ